MHLVWFRRDLRLTDNEIVTLATADGDAKPQLTYQEFLYCTALALMSFQDLLIGQRGRM